LMKGCARVGKTSRPASGSSTAWSSSAPLPVGGQPTQAITTRIPAIGFLAHDPRGWAITPRRYEPHEFPSLFETPALASPICARSAREWTVRPSTPRSIFAAFREKMRRYRPKTIAFHQQEKPRAFFMDGRRKAVVLGRQLPSRRFSTTVVRAGLRHPAPASGHWSVQPWRELAGCDQFVGRISQRVARTRAPMINSA